MTRQTKAKAISKSVAKAVWERDRGRCIICQSPNAIPRCHYIRRSQGGLGIEQNIVTLCQVHHEQLDSPPTRDAKGQIRTIVRMYLDRKYPGFTNEQRVYQK